jgi:8-oxo-dGTP pyrophosphatase MutT (NUDIX family)
MSPFTLRRNAARVVLLDSVGQVLLLRARDPANHVKPPWWEIPGGGIDPNETSADCAARELFEEAGITDARIGPCVWTQEAQFSFGGLHFDQFESVHIAWIDRVGTEDDYQPAHLEALEALAFHGHQWWELDALLACADPVLPYRLREFLPHLVRGELPDEPVDITHPEPPW